ncbi:integumentary mucin C.1 [Drosophila subpulchrella]|uniref:integumentary mucin C.1 n=1 Tax=Drosophila subpulchrella TaxID=1486046 RepID=UPI0018A16D36|nr:integumentary mucin C.1 [Drosophila subpulchrella]
MLRTFAILLVIAVAVNARAAPQRTTVSPDYETTENVELIEESTYMSVEEGTITVDVDSDLILTTSPEGEAFTEASPMGLTEEPLPDSVVQQLEMERAQEERLKNPEEPESELESESENEEQSATTTEPPNSNNTGTTRRSFKFGATTLPPSFITTTERGITTIAPQEVTTSRSSETEETTEFQEVRTMRNYFERKPAQMGEIDLDMAENRMETTTNIPAQEPVELSMIMTTEAALVEENPKPNSESDQAESVETTVVPLYQYVSNGAPIVTEPQPEHSTVMPVLNEEVASTVSPLEEIKELLLVSSTSAPETTTEAEETTTQAFTTTTTTTEAVVLTTKVETLLNAQPETTTSAPETSTSTTSAPETTTSTTSAPTTTSTTSTTSAPTTTTTTTTERPIQTRAPRVERIFNSDGVEVLYGYSSVVRTNRS